MGRVEDALATQDEDVRDLHRNGRLTRWWKTHAGPVTILSTLSTFFPDVTPPLYPIRRVAKTSWGSVESNTKCTQWRRDHFRSDKKWMAAFGDSDRQFRNAYNDVNNTLEGSFASSIKWFRKIFIFKIDYSQQQQRTSGNLIYIYIVCIYYLSCDRWNRLREKSSFNLSPAIETSGIMPRGW